MRADMAHCHLLISVCWCCWRPTLFVLVGEYVHHENGCRVHWRRYRVCHWRKTFVEHHVLSYVRNEVKVPESEQWIPRSKRRKIKKYCHWKRRPESLLIMMIEEKVPGPGKGRRGKNELDGQFIMAWTERSAWSQRRIFTEANEIWKCWCFACRLWQVTELKLMLLTVKLTYWNYKLLLLTTGKNFYFFFNWFINHIFDFVRQFHKFGPNNMLKLWLECMKWHHTKKSSQSERNTFKFKFDWSFRGSPFPLPPPPSAHGHGPGHAASPSPRLGLGPWPSRLQRLLHVRS